MKDSTSKKKIWDGIELMNRKRITSAFYILVHHRRNVIMFSSLWYFYNSGKFSNYKLGYIMANESDLVVDVSNEICKQSQGR